MSKNFSKNDITKNNWSVFLVTSLGVGIAAIDSGIMNVALPTIAKEFHTTNILHVQWLISSYLLVICVFLPICGKLGDIYLRRSIYLYGFLIFTLSSFFCGIAAELYQLIIFRFLQGIGAALILANNQAIIMMNINKENRGKALGINSTIVAVGLVIGPGLGGLIISMLNWRYIFYVNVPLGLLGCLIGLFILPNIKHHIIAKLDIMGAILFAIAMIFLLSFLGTETQTNNAILVIIKIVISITAFVMFFYREKNSKYPIFDLKIISRRQFSFSAIAAFLSIMALTFSNIILPFYLQNFLAFPPQVVGFILLIMPVFVIIVAPISGYLSNKVMLNILTGTGLIIIIAGLIIQSQFTYITNIWWLILSQILLGMGFGLFQSPNNYRMMTALPSSHLSIGNGLASLMRNSGRTIGTVFAASIFSFMQGVSCIKLHIFSNLQPCGFKIVLLLASFIVLIAIFFSFAQNITDSLGGDNL